MENYEANVFPELEYNAIETRKRKRSWNVFLSLILFYGYNEKTTGIAEMSGAFPVFLEQTLKNTGGVRNVL